MYDISYRNIRKGIFFGLTFFLAGLFFFVLLCWITFGGMIKRLYMNSSTVATSINENCYYDDDGSYVCSPIYKYKVNGKEYTCNIGYSSSNRLNSEQTKVYYNSANPSDCVTDYTVKPDFFMYLICLFPLIFIYVGGKHMLDIKKRIEKIKYLAQNGTLVQGLSYVMERTGMASNDRQIMAPAVDYTLPSGSVIHLTGDPRYDGQYSDEDGLVDLLIDPNDPDNYYIDFNIKKKQL